MANRKIIKTDKNPDVLVTYHTYTEKKEVTTRNNYPMGMGYGWGYGGWGYGWGGYYPYYGGFNNWNSVGDTYTYTEGVLIIDFIDNQTKEVVWRGSVDGNVDNADKINKKIEKAVQSIMKKTPMERSDNIPS
jgi:hypothetical protein